MKKAIRFVILFLTVFFTGIIVPVKVTAFDSFRQTPPPDAFPPDSILKVKQYSYVNKAAAAKIKPTGFVQNFLSAFSLKKNTNANEKIRIMALFDSLRLDTNLAINIKNIETIRERLTSNNEYIIDSLINGMRSVDSLKHTADVLWMKWDSLKLKADSMQYAYSTDLSWSYNISKLLRIPKYLIANQLKYLPGRSGPESSDKINDSTVLLPLKPASYTDSIAMALSENNIYFFPRPPVNETDRVYFAHADETLTELEKQRRYWYLFNYIVYHPCGNCIPNKDSPDVKIISYQYMSDLGLDSIIKAVNMERIGHNKLPFFSRFEYIHHILKRWLKISTLVLLAVLLALIGIYYQATIKKGDRWMGKKLMGHMNSIITYFFLVSLISFLYCADVLPYVGISPASNPGYVLNNIAVPETTDSLKKTNLADYVQAPDCNCVNISLPAIVLVVSILFLISYLLIIPGVVKWIKKKEIP